MCCYQAEKGERQMFRFKSKMTHDTNKSTENTIKVIKIITVLWLALTAAQNSLSQLASTAIILSLKFKQNTEINVFLKKTEKIALKYIHE